MLQNTGGSDTAVFDCLPRGAEFLASVLEGVDVGTWRFAPDHGDRPLGQQSGREFAPAVPKTGASDAAVSTHEVATEIRLGPRLLAQPISTPNATLSTEKHSRLAARLHWPSGRALWDEGVNS